MLVFEIAGGILLAALAAARILAFSSGDGIRMTRLGVVFGITSPLNGADRRPFRWLVMRLHGL